MKVSLIIVGAILFVTGLLFAYSNPIITLYLTICGIGCFFAGIILQIITKNKVKKDEKSVTRKRQFWGSDLELIIAGILFFIIASIGLSSYRYSKVGLGFIVLGAFGLLLILFAFVRIIISLIKGEEKRWKLFAGWLFFILGAILFGSATLPPLKASVLILIIGIILGIVGLIFISLHITASNLQGIMQIRQILNNLGSIFLVLGIVGIGLIGYNPSLQKIFYISIIVAIVIYIISLLLKTLVKKEGD